MPLSWGLRVGPLPPQGDEDKGVLVLTRAYREEREEPPTPLAFPCLPAHKPSDCKNCSHLWGHAGGNCRVVFLSGKGAAGFQESLSLSPLYFLDFEI